MKLLLYLIGIFGFCCFLVIYIPVITLAQALDWVDSKLRKKLDDLQDASQ